MPVDSMAINCIENHFEIFVTVFSLLASRKDHHLHILHATRQFALLLASRRLRRAADRRAGRPQRVTTYVGLCAACRHARIIESRRGSRFWLCARSRLDPRFPRYPPLPVIRCAGHDPGRPEARHDEPNGEHND